MKIEVFNFYLSEELEELRPVSHATGAHRFVRVNLALKTNTMGCGSLAKSKFHDCLCRAVLNFQNVKATVTNGGPRGDIE